MKYYRLLTTSVFLVVVACASTDVLDPEAPTKEVTRTSVGFSGTEYIQQNFNTMTWQPQLQEIAASDQTENEKFDAVTRLSRTYFIDEATSAVQVKYLVEEYESGDYITRLSEDEYALTNIFISYLIEREHDDSQELPIDRFAFDFWQNSKYVYRGIDEPDSEAVKANEDQMDSSLNSGTFDH